RGDRPSLAADIRGVGINDAAVFQLRRFPMYVYKRVTMLLVVLAATLLGGAQVRPAQEKPAKADGGGFERMFDLPKFWIYNGETRRWAFTGDGTIVSEGEGGGWLMHPRQFGDLELSLEYKMTAGGNSGVVLRCPPEPPEGRSGIQAEPAS